MGVRYRHLYLNDSDRWAAVSLLGLNPDHMIGGDYMLSVLTSRDYGWPPVVAFTPIGRGTGHAPLCKSAIGVAGDPGLLDRAGRITYPITDGGILNAGISLMPPLGEHRAKIQNAH